MSDAVVYNFCVHSFFHNIGRTNCSGKVKPYSGCETGVCRCVGVYMLCVWVWVGVGVGVYMLCVWVWVYICERR